MDVRPALMGNKLLAALPETDREHLRRHLRRVEVPFGEAVHTPGTRRHRIYFPVDCVFSAQFVTAAGSGAEVASIGNEGLVGLPLLLGASGTPSRTVVQVAGSAWCGDGIVLRDEFSRSVALQHVVLRFTEALMIQMGQNAACYQHHSIEQQFCLWLLLMLDRTRSSHLHVTQEFVALTLGIRREGVNEVASRLMRDGIIRHTRGSIDVLDRARLERACCECYGIISHEYARLLP
ncbi:MAG: Crp/Fnr family transcriptional regulator [Rhodanobacteraceae bacterium]